MALACSCSTSAPRPVTHTALSGRRIAPAKHAVRQVSRRLCAVTRAEVSFPTPKAPEGVTVPQRQPEVAPARFGFVDNAERINSRACMIGFFALLAVEFAAHRGLLELVGIRTGSGLGFEF